MTRIELKSEATAAALDSGADIDLLSTAEIDSFRKNGFLAIPQLIDAYAVATLRQVYDAMLSGEIDCALVDKPLGDMIRQIRMPERFHPVFEKNEALRRARRMAAQLLEVEDPVPIFQMLMYKEPGQMATTPWHQDFAYSQIPFRTAGAQIPHSDALQFWLALDDVDVENGCMHFIPGVHRGKLLPHHIFAGEEDSPQRLLAIPSPGELLTLDEAVPCPLRAGGATIHTPGTPHFTPGNRTLDRPRRAYTFNFTRPGIAGQSLTGFDLGGARGTPA
jgi:hypothetical protein